VVAQEVVDQEEPVVQELTLAVARENIRVVQGLQVKDIQEDMVITALDLGIQTLVLFQELVITITVAAAAALAVEV
jgi:hypothetical protein